MRRKNRGTALIITLMVLTALTALVASYSATQRISSRGVVRRNENLLATRMAEAGLVRAMAELSVQTTDVPATILDPWAQLGQLGSERFVVGEGSFRLEIIDAGALVNLNTATEEQLLRLPLTTEQVDSLLDWREDGVGPRPEGAKDEYYTQLDNPYITAMRPLLSFDELLLVKGFDPQTLYDPPLEDQPNPNYVPGTGEEQLSLYQLCTVESQAPATGINGVNRTNINNVNAQQMIQIGIPQPTAQAIIDRRNNVGTFTGLGEVMEVPGVTLEVAGLILDNFVAGGTDIETGKININTAEESVLTSVPGITSDIAQGIIARQNIGYQALSELTTVPGIDIPVLQEAADYFTIASRMFIVRVIGVAGQTTVSMQAVVVLEDTGPRIIKRITPPFQDMRNYWRWDIEPTADVIVWEKQ